MSGGCHCGAVRFRVTFLKAEAIDCNCSICRKKGFLHGIVPPEQFDLLSGAADLVSYRFNTGQAEHLFCRHCGIHAFYHPRSHPGYLDVNLHCLDAVQEDPDFLQRFEIQPFDGQHWEANRAKLR
ncbi:GFA family protein [Lyngbya confervoides BDU141951]|uniref:GFA family protein n=2 Tax=Lyngbya TaxID=28073 RepID=A0ABD4T2Q4_9CYAN|nr:GFA family protein [Lyngbya confervoides]MCM1982983.1 GFA family protein [Lyngbya confervoides BDU141951]